MTKYYRVRSQEQWDWLNKKLKEQGRAHSAIPFKDLKKRSFEDWKKRSFEDWNDGDLGVYDEDSSLFGWGNIYRISREHNVSLGSFIEVSDLMEDEKMEDYVTIKDGDLLEVKDENILMAFYPDHLDYWHGDFKELLIPKSLLYPKIKMTRAEKAEFAALNKEWKTLSLAISAINDEFLKYPLLHNQLFGRITSAEKNEAQLEFARAWADPSLIEVIKEPKYNVKVPNTKDCLYYKINNSVRAGVPQRYPSRFKFTKSELKQYGLDSDMYEKVEVQE